jgi:hypothetical protein
MVRETLLSFIVVEDVSETNLYHHCYFAIFTLLF